MKYVKTDKAHVLKGHPSELEVILFEKGVVNTKVPYTNCVNGTFFTYQHDGKYFSLSPLVADGKPQRWGACHAPKHQSCFVFYKDGTVAMERLINVAELDLNKVKHVVGGVGLVNKNDKSFMYDPVGEGFGTDILRNCEKTVMAYRNGEVFLLTCKMYHSSSTQYDLLDLCKDHDFDMAISLDGGGSTFLKHGNTYKENGDGRKVHNIIRFNGQDTTEPQKPTTNHTIIVDIGHHECDSGAVNGSIREVDLNVSISKHLITTLERHGVKVVVTTGTLDNRVKVEHEVNPSYFVSIHNNAGGGDGAEVILYDKKHPQLKLAENILNEITSQGLNNSRGIKENKSLYVLRKTYCPAVIVECAFVDTKDVEAVDTEDERKAFGVAIAQGILKTLGITYVAEAISSNKIYRVCTGSYADIDNAKKEVDKLKKEGYSAFIAEYAKEVQ